MKKKMMDGERERGKRGKSEFLDDLRERNEKRKERSKRCGS